MIQKLKWSDLELDQDRLIDNAGDLQSLELTNAQPLHFNF